jgi:hypothetical protein
MAQLTKSTGAITALTGGLDGGKDNYILCTSRTQEQVEQWRSNQDGELGFRPTYDHYVWFDTPPQNDMPITITSPDAVVKAYTYDDADSGWQTNDTLEQHANGDTARIGVDYTPAPVVKTAAHLQKVTVAGSGYGGSAVNNIFAIAYSEEYDDTATADEAPDLVISGRHSHSPVAGNWTPFMEGEACSAFLMRSQVADNNNCINYRTRLRWSSWV